MNDFSVNEFEQMYDDEIKFIKLKLRLEAESQITANINVDTGALRDSLEVYWEGDELMAETDTDYDRFVRLGYVSEEGTIIDGNDYFDVQFNTESL